MALLLAVLPALPIWMRSVFRRSALASTNTQVGVLFGFYACLAISVFLAFFLAWFSFALTFAYFAPYVTGLVPLGDFYDEPLTPRGLVFFLVVTLVPSFVFFKVGLLSVRDVHQTCKEQTDRVRKRHQLGALWTGI
jgi:hypothetical protein